MTVNDCILRRVRIPLMNVLLICMYVMFAMSAQAADCTAHNGMEPFCTVEKPEDMESIGQWVLISEYGSLDGSHAGRLTLFNPTNNATRVLYPAGNDAAATDSQPAWGDAACQTPPGAQLSPHGIHHSALGGEERLYVVSHGGREAVELFEILNAGDFDTFALQWRGCVPAPDGSWINDVVGLGNGALAVTHMVSKGISEEALIEAETAQATTGAVFEWQPAQGWHKVPNSDGSLPNGLEVSTDGSTLFINEYLGDRVTALERASGRRLWQTPVDGPDNSSWAVDGRLLVASHLVTLEEVFHCTQTPLTMCPLAYTIVALEADTGYASTVFRDNEPSVIGGATIALDHDGWLYLGSFVGDRMARVRVPAAP